MLHRPLLVALRPLRGVSSLLLAGAAAAVWAQPPPAPPPGTPPNAPAVTASGFRIYDNQHLPDDIEVIRDIVYGQGGALTLKLNIVRQKNQAGPPRPVIVYFPGGGWVTSDKEVATGRLAALAQHGFTGVAVRFRTSGEGKFPAQIEDSKCAIRFLRAKAAAYHLDPDRIGVWGASAGGTLAALLGTTPGLAALEGTGGWPEYSSRVQAVSAWYPLADFRGIEAPDPENYLHRLFGASPHAVPGLAALASPLVHVTGDSAPCYVVVGDREAPVLVRDGAALVTALQLARVEATLLMVPEAGHGFITATEAEQMLGFFQRHLQGPKPPG
jgi:acetyl esterase/lipase